MKQIPAHHALRTPQAPTYMLSGPAPLSQALLNLDHSLGCRISTTLHPRRLVVHSSTRVQCQYSPYSLNYQQEGYIFKLEMKELYKHCAMEKSSSRSYIPGKKSASLYRKTSEFN